MTGLRAAIRAQLLEQHKKDLGEIKPPLEYNSDWLVRVRYLVWVESLVNVGCKFQLNDLPMQVWNELIALAQERAFVDRLLHYRREKQADVDRGMSKSREATGLPPPGKSIFSMKGKGKK